MGITDDKIKDLKAREAKLLKLGGDKAVAQHEKGKLTARERLNLLFDPGTFLELDMFVEHRCSELRHGQGRRSPATASSPATALVNGRPVFAFAQDFTVARRHASARCTPRRSARPWTWP